MLKSISQAIGYLYFADIDDTNNSISVHYALSQRYWNMGVMTETCICIFNFAFTVLGVKRIHSHHHIDNPSSGRVLQKSGMWYIKTEYKQLLDYEQISGDYYYYEITFLNWKTVK